MVISTALASTLISACFFAICAFVTHGGVILVKKWTQKKNQTKQQQAQAQKVIQALQNMSTDDIKKVQQNLKAL